MQQLRNLKGVTLPRGNYELIERHAVTNMSVLYRARDQSSGQTVAVKILANTRYENRFRNEAETSYGMQVRNFATTLRYDLDGEQLPDGTKLQYLVMKWLSGPSLKDRIRDDSTGSTTVEKLAFVQRLLRELAPALDDIHHRGIIHRDIKPSNILYNSDKYENDEPYLIDFGIAKRLRAAPGAVEREPELADATLVEQTGIGERVGTNNYMPPEQWAAAETSGATDQYALAITIYEVLANGRSPYDRWLDKKDSNIRETGTSPTEDERRLAWFEAHVSIQPTPIREYRPDVPVAVWEVLERGMAKRPADRYPSIQAFADAFDAAPKAPIPSASAGAGIPADDPVKQRPGWLPIAAIGIIVIAIAVVILIVLSQGGEATPEEIAQQQTQAALALAEETETPTSEPSNTAEPSDTPQTTSTPTNEATSTDTPEPSPTNTAEQTDTNTPEPTASNTLQPSATNTPAPTQTSTPRLTLQAIVTGTAQALALAQVSTEAVPSPTSTATPTDTEVPPTRTPRPSATPTDTMTSSPTASNTPFIVPTVTPRPRTATPTASPTATDRPTRTANPTAEDTVEATNTQRPRPTIQSSPTETETATVTETSAPTETLTSTPTPTEPAEDMSDPLTLLDTMRTASRSSNNFDCAAYVSSMSDLNIWYEGEDEDLIEALAPLFDEEDAASQSLLDYCDRPGRRDDESVQLPTQLASRAFRDLRGLLRTVILEVTALSSSE